MMFFFFKQKTAYEMRISDWSQTCALPISSILHRGRLHVELDLKNAADKAKLLDLVELADGLIEGASRRYGALGPWPRRMPRAESCFGLWAHDWLGTGRAADRKSTRLNSSH